MLTCRVLSISDLNTKVVLRECLCACGVADLPQLEEEHRAKRHTPRDLLLERLQQVLHVPVAGDVEDEGECAVAADERIHQTEHVVDVRRRTELGQCDVLDAPLELDLLERERKGGEERKKKKERERERKKEIERNKEKEREKRDKKKGEGEGEGERKR